MNITRKFLLILFWLSVMLAALGFIITFVPGAEFNWFLIVAVLSMAGLFIPKKVYQIAAALLLLLALSQAYHGYRRGVEYQQWLATQRVGTP